MSTKLQKDDLSIAVLSGGKSSRMNYEDKGLIEFNGFSVLSRIIEILTNILMMFLSLLIII